MPKTFPQPLGLRPFELRTTRVSQEVDAIDAGMRASTTVQAGRAKRWFRHTRSTKAGVLGVGTPTAVIIFARPRPRDFDVEGRAGETASGGHVRVQGPWPREANEGDPQGCEPRRGQRRNEVRRKSGSGHSLSLFYCYFSVASKGSLRVRKQRTSISLTSLGREREQI